MNMWFMDSVFITSFMGSLPRSCLNSIRQSACRPICTHHPAGDIPCTALMGGVRTSLFTLVHEQSVADRRWPLIDTRAGLFIPGTTTLERGARRIGKSFAALLLRETSSSQLLESQPQKLLQLSASLWVKAPTTFSIETELEALSLVLQAVSASAKNAMVISDLIFMVFPRPVC